MKESKIVKKEIPAKIIFETESLKLVVGSSQTIEATFLPTNFEDKVIWSSTNPSIATVNEGIVTDFKEGKTIIIAKSHENGKVDAICRVQVKNPKEMFKVFVI